MRQVEIEDVLEPGERLVWEGRPESWLTLGRVWRRRVALTFAAGVVVLAILVGAALATFGVVDSFGTGFGVALLGGCAAGALFYVASLAAWRTARYGVTDRRVIAVDPEGVVLAIPRRRVLRVTEWSGDLVVLDPDETTIRFEGIRDKEAARFAIEGPRPGSIESDRSAPPG